MSGKLKLAFVLLSAFLLHSCSREYDPYYLKDDTVGIIVDSKTLLKYDELTCQVSYSRSENKFAAFKDDMSSYFILTLGSAPVASSGSIGNCSVKYTTSNDVVSQSGLNFSVEKRDDASGLLWLWCREKKIFIVAQML